MSSDAIDGETFRGLQDAAGAEFVDELVEAFLEDAPKMLTALHASLAGGDEDAFRRTAHSLKSNSLTFGAQGLAAIARELELTAHAVVQRADPGVLDALPAEYSRVEAALRERRSA